MLAALWETIVINLQPWKGFLVAILEISFYINEIKSITPGTCKRSSQSWTCVECGVKIKPMIRFRSKFFRRRLLLFVERVSTIYHSRSEHVGKMFSRQL